MTEEIVETGCLSYKSTGTSLRVSVVCTMPHMTGLRLGVVYVYGVRLDSHSCMLLRQSITQPGSSVTGVKNGSRFTGSIVTGAKPLAFEVDM